jgi:16S rRNA (guanine966-N2)-methyltransferase
MALRALRDNVEALGLADRARVMRGDAARAVATLAAQGHRFAVAFLDPPYESPRAAPALAALADGVCLLPGAVVVVQHATRTPPALVEGSALTLWKSRKFGETTLTFLSGPA